jgi:lysine 2,3-aminomutase
MYPADKISNWFDGKGHWSEIADENWFNWKWQMRNRLTKKEHFQKYLKLTESEIKGFDIAQNKLSVAVTPYFFNLIDPNNPNCPVRKQVLPSVFESNTSSDELNDPVGEEKFMPVPGVVHRYPDRVLFLVTDRCASYCRYCTRSRLVSNAQDYSFHPELESSLSYIEKNSSIRDVLLSGGDPFILSDDKLEYILNRLNNIDHVEFIRIGSRIPVFMPQRITDRLLDIFKSVKNLWVSIHVNHPSECTRELSNACFKLSSCGIPLGNQSVLLKEINDNTETMKSLVHRLLMMKVKPYYLYQCDLIKGSSHLRTDPSVGLKIIQELRGHTSGYAIPQFVIDAPGGGGKIPLNPDYLVEFSDNKILLKNYKGKLFNYPTKQALTNQSFSFIQ